jgi:hypothetical protein
MESFWDRNLSHLYPPFHPPHQIPVSSIFLFCILLLLPELSLPHQSQPTPYEAWPTGKTSDGTSCVSCLTSWSSPSVCVALITKGTKSNPSFLVQKSHGFCRSRIPALCSSLAQSQPDWTHEYLELVDHTSASRTRLSLCSHLASPVGGIPSLDRMLGSSLSHLSVQISNFP